MKWAVSWNFELGGTIYVSGLKSPIIVKSILLVKNQQITKARQVGISEIVRPLTSTVPQGTESTRKGQERISEEKR